jgi:nitroimidazol reductase NimA-like FMN-containing flavoprotein (pyridoxamine 5'-phosphate oxidase superfamily)
MSDDRVSDHRDTDAGTPRTDPLAPRAIRRADRKMSETCAREVLARGYAGRLGSVGHDGWPYVVPLLYVWRDGEIWLHTAAVRGHLRENIDHEPRVCFEVDEPGEVFPYGRFECDTALEYRSVVAFGRIRVVEDRGLKAAFCDALMARYGDPGWARPAGFYPRLDQITVYAIALERLAGKETALPAAEDRWPLADHTRTPHTRP